MGRAGWWTVAPAARRGAARDTVEAARAPSRGDRCAAPVPAAALAAQLAAHGHRTPATGALAGRNQRAPAARGPKTARSTRGRAPATKRSSGNRSQESSSSSPQQPQPHLPPLPPAAAAGQPACPKWGAAGQGATEADRPAVAPGVFTELSDAELRSVIAFLGDKLGTAPITYDSKALYRNFIHGAWLEVPPKQEVLAHLDNGGPKPVRKVGCNLILFEQRAANL